jgi:Ca2+-binding EF-hand superfamily protein
MTELMAKDVRASRRVGQIVAYPPSGKPAPLSFVEQFGIAALAPSLACIFTNPFDTIKIRMQLQGEGQAVYKNSFDALTKIIKLEGPLALERGLTPAILKEASKNVFRLGLFEPIMNILHDPSHGSAPVWTRMLAGGISGVVGALSCNPFELVKTQIQSKSSNPASQVGFQHQHKGVLDALTTIVKKDGVKGLYRGSGVNMMRSFIGSSSNLSAYSLMKEYLMTKRHWKDDAKLDTIAGLIAGGVSVIFMNPTDVVRSRLYNQPFENGKGLYYENAWDCLRKTVKAEGVKALWTGSGPHFLRIGPHFALSFLFLGVFRRKLIDYHEDKNLSECFRQLDGDGDGRLDFYEVATALRNVVPMPTRLTPHLYDEKINSYTQRIFGAAGQTTKTGISMDLFKTMTREVNGILREQAIEQVFNNFDKDGDRVLSSKDLMRVLMTLPKPPGMSEPEHERLIQRNVLALLVEATGSDAVDSIDLKQFSKLVANLENVSQNDVLKSWAHKTGLRPPVP